MQPLRQITRADILPMPVYAMERADRRRQMTELKRNRRLAVGPHVMLLFESFETMLHQVHEMLYIEKGGEAQIEDELAAYNPLIPDGRSLVATMLIEIEDAERRARLLATFGGIEETVGISFNGDVVKASPELDVERTTPDGKTSSVHFLKFFFTPAQIEVFRKPGTRVVIGVRHPNYDHMAALPEAVRSELARDFA
ncbi:conserved hypothetical protein [Candidatus Defluviicoccus seviourii]|uniref:DUF3501 family protein n=1 Tax=Candidatus Defluviicoccus seviourii TaxID=2565273 RepID=A0A564WAD2_9PROT|nr:conserved hypothetical protein [Candidatus Defluviicoccus seviourii]